MADRSAIATATFGYIRWAEKPHNAKWVRMIDGTPIPNDLPVCIANEFAATIATLRAENEALRAQVATTRADALEEAAKASAILAEREKSRKRVEELEAALRKADLWTDEENDVGPWRDEARTLLRAKDGTDA